MSPTLYYLSYADVIYRLAYLRPFSNLLAKNKPLLYSQNNTRGGEEASRKAHNLEAPVRFRAPQQAN